MAGRARLGITALGAALVLAACSSNLGAPDPASDQADSISSLWRGTVIAALVVGLFVWGLIGWALIRFRRRTDDVPSQKAHNVPLEVVYTAIPVLIVATLFFFTMRTQREITDLDPNPDVKVEIIGFQWQWQFRYEAPDGGRGPTITGASVGAPPELVLPVGETTRLRLVSEDVNHSFWVPRFLSKRDLIPGVDNQLDIVPNREGTYTGRCTEFCGLDHWRMNFSVRVVSQDDYERWLAEQGTGGS
jgi:cytochrome c oxidase subunit II